MQISIFTDKSYPTRWRWGIVDDTGYTLACSPENATMTWAEAFDAARGHMRAMASFNTQRFAMPMEKNNDQTKKPIDLPLESE